MGHPATVTPKSIDLPTGARLVMTLVVRDEEEILEANLDYHLAQGVDFVLVTDHGSRDATPEILRRYEAMGVAHVIREEGDEHHQSRRVTHMAHLAATRYAADWIIHNDADEFWWPELGSLRDVFSSIPAAYGQLTVRRHNFLPAPGREPFYEAMTIREAESRNGIGQPLEGKVAHRGAPDVLIAPGNHSISGAELEPAPALEVVEILHFPMRSYTQFERKVVSTGTAYENLTDRSPLVGRDQLELLARYRAGRLREHYDAAVLDEAQIEEGLRRGTLVRDRRLARFLSERDRQAGELERPDAPRARRLIGHAFTTAAELAAESRRRAELEHRNADLEAHAGRVEKHHGELQAHVRGLEAHIGGLDADVHALEARTRELEDALRETSTALETIRTSRLMRFTAPARRIWYRLSGR